MKRMRLLVVGLAVGLCFAAGLRAEERGGGAAVSDCCMPGEVVALRPGDEMWLISTRHLHCPTVDGSGPQVLRYDCDLGWQSAELAELATSEDPGRVTIFNVHGNRVDWDEAIRRGWRWYGELTAGAPPQPAVRFVVWSWPSEQVPGPLRDFRVKAARTDVHGYYLGWVLSQFDPQLRVSLMGYSLGARIVTGGLHVLGGGTLAGLALSADARQPQAGVRVAVMGAALPNYWLLPGHYHQHAPRQINRMLLIYNSCDVVLQHFHRTDKYHRPQALGYTGLVGAEALGAAGRRIDQMDICGLIGRQHDMRLYVGSPPIVDQVRWYTLWQPVGR